MNILSLERRFDNKKHGFTIAEILLTLAIVGMIAALGVPMLGQQKLRKPEQLKQKHGTFECYYDDEGNLHSYYADSEEAPNGIEDQHISGNTCRFTPPVGAENFVIQAVGAGGDGGGVQYVSGGNAGGSPHLGPQLIALPWYQSSSKEVNGEVSTGVNFQAEMKKLKDANSWVYYQWNYQWAPVYDDVSPADGVQYTIVSPLGSGGRDVEDRRTQVGEKECQDNCAIWHPSCENSCFKVVSAKGGRGGRGSLYTIKTQLWNTDNVNYTISNAVAGISFSAHKYLNLVASKNGEKGVINNNNGNLEPKDGANGTGHGDSPFTNVFVEYDSVKDGNSYYQKDTESGNRVTSSGGAHNSNNIQIVHFEKYVTDGQPNIPVSQSMTNQVSGQIFGPNPATIKYRSRQPAIYADFFTAGEPGNAVLRVYEKIPSSTTLILSPGIRRSPHHGSMFNTPPSTVSMQDGNSESVFNVLSAQSGSDGEAILELLPVDKNDRIFPRKYGAEYFLPKESAFVVSHGVGYRSRIALMSANYRHGESGGGSYPVLSNIDSQDAEQFINDVKVGETTTDSMNFEPPYMCFDGTEAIQNSADTYYCASNGKLSGHAGAIAIKW